MKYKEIDGIIFEKMMKSGLKNIRLYEKEINNLNVFPVPDGDTGTNMRRTVELGVETARTTKNLNEYLKQLSSGMLLGARGNSGVILSQIFKGMSDALTRYETADAGNLSVAFIRGYMAAYSSVMRPVEGTILTVVREGIERTKQQIYRKTTIDTMLGIYLSEMKKTLSATPYMLPILKEAGVVDSGGFGYIKIIEGMLKYLYNEEIEQPDAETEEPDLPNTLDEGAFGANSTFDYGYCMEFLLQLMNKKRPVKKFDVADYIEEIKLYGNSLVVIQDKSRVKVHIHTFKPEKVISLSREHGEFLTFKLENMQLQHNEFVGVKKDTKRPHKPVAILAVADGEGVERIFTERGCDMLINGGVTMNTSVKEFIDAYKELNADKIIVLPNDKNIIYAAKQAAEMFKDGAVEILPTPDIARGYLALASDMPDRPFDERISAMRDGYENTSTVTLAHATKDRTIGGVKCISGQYVAFLNGKLIFCVEDAVSGAVRAVKQVEGIEDKEQLIVFVGAGCDCADKLKAELEGAFPDMAVDFIDGGQSSTELVIAVF